MENNDINGYVGISEQNRSEDSIGFRVMLYIK